MTKATAPAPIRIHAQHIEMIPRADLRPFDRNARTHSKAQVEALAAIIKEHGWTVPLLVSKAGVVIAGHGRLEAADLLGIDPIPCVRAKNLSSPEIRALRISDNQLALRAGWDFDALREEIVELDTIGVDLDLLGFEDFDLQNILLEREDGENDPNAEWRGMPEFDQRDKTAFRSLHLHFKDQAAVDAFAALVGQKITPNTRFLWYPEIEIETYADKRYSVPQPAPGADLHSDQGAVGEQADRPRPRSRRRAVPADS